MVFICSRFRVLEGVKINLIITLFFFSSTTLTFAAPTGGVVTSGAASINQNETVTNINQTSNKATINWQNFSIKVNETVNFNQPNSNSITLNRVIGNEKSIINGALNANGQVWILNSNGVLFGKNASINTSGLLATTAKLSDKDFNAGNYNFKNTTANSIINQGTIEVINNGSVILASNEVVNDGTIKAIKGSVHLVGSDSYSINLNGNSLVNLTVDKGVLDAMVSNSGKIIADGGNIYLTTNAVDELLKGVVNNTGIIEANSIDDITGYVELFAHGGEALVDGDITAKGGFIETSGKKIKFSDTLAINAGEGGTWLIDPNNIKIVSDAIAESNVDSSGAPLYTSLDDTTILRASTVESQLNNGTNVIVETGESGTNSQDGDIFIGTNINKTSGADATLTLKAHRNILFAEDYSLTSLGSISSTSNRLNVVLWSDSDGNNDGSIWLPEGSSISSKGGHVWLGGGDGSSTWNGLTVGDSYAVGSVFSSSEGNAISRGVAINGNIFADGDSFGGDIFIKGLASTSSHYTSARGVSISGSVTTNYNGNISIEGKAKGASDAVAIGDTSSALTDGSAILRVNNGTIFINGYSNQGNSSSDSIYLNNKSYIESTGTGTLIIDGNDDEISADSTSYIKIANLLLKNGFTTTLTHANNDIKTLAATGMTSLTYIDLNDITIGTVNGVNGITANGDVNLFASDIFVNKPISNGSNILNLNATGDIYYISDKPVNNESKNTDNSYLINANSFYTIKDFPKFDNINNKSISSVDLPNIEENAIYSQLSNPNEILGKNTTEKNISSSYPIINSTKKLTEQSTNSSKQSESSSKNVTEQKTDSIVLNRESSTNLIEQNTNSSSISENSNENLEEQETDSSNSSENSREETTDSTNTSESSNHDTTEEDTIHLGEAQIEIDVDENGKIVYSKSQIEVKVKNNGKLVFSNNSKDILETVGLSIKDVSLVKNKIEIGIIDKKTTSKYSATLLDGSSFPGYLILNPKTGKINGFLPKDMRKLGINIKAMDKDKTIRILSLKIKF
ncbi:MAG: filamentous hemagglutinin N-terminal domain-containing protein [Arcobacter sp.]|uniref:two-partner secretion domain-containing protein n=1 Tax=Arcobacter sp. TaxID=1872629 RepID=UPI003C75F51A